MATCPVFLKESKLTGRARFRRQRITGLPILQVEVVISRYQYPHKPSNFQYKKWRDATFEEAVCVTPTMITQQKQR